jgi:hypothetical protein
MLVLGACAQAPAEGDLRVLFSDHRDAIGDFSHFGVEIESVELHRSNQPTDLGWIKLDTQIRQLDLTELVGDKFEHVVEYRLPSDYYDAIRVNLTNVGGTLLSGEQIALDDFSATSRLEFHMESDRTSTLMVDLKVQSHHDHPGGGYVLVLGESRKLD